MSFPAMAHANGNGHHATPPWMKDSVRHFFEGISWTGKPRLPLASATAAVGRAASSTSPLTMSVYDFFESVAWNGQPTIAAPIAPLEMQSETPPPPEEDDLTLDGLFG
jgi:hypothetical protein